MADMNVSFNAIIRKGLVNDTLNPGPLGIDLASAAMVGGIQNVGTTAESFSAGDVGTLGYAFFQNVSDTNYVEIGPDSSGTLIPFLRLQPGEYSWVKLKPGITIKGMANTAAVNVLYRIYGA